MAALETSKMTATNPFFKAVYNRAAKIDKLYADHMDTCIIK